MSQQTLADHAGVSQPVISRLESGTLNGIRWQTLARIVGVLQAAGAFHRGADCELAPHYELASVVSGCPIRHSRSMAADAHLGLIVRSHA